MTNYRKILNCENLSVFFSRGTFETTIFAIEYVFQLHYAYAAFEVEKYHTSNPGALICRAWGLGVVVTPMLLAKITKILNFFVLSEVSPSTVGDRLYSDSHTSSD